MDVPPINNAVILRLLISLQCNPLEIQTSVQLITLHSPASNIPHPATPLQS